jgi:WhiB family redox-sensing transcriptional regulator
VGVTGAAVGHIAAAKAVCRACTVREECLEFAISTNQEYGVWGGTSEEERRVLRRAWRARQRRAAS